ncbi:hypothetical protein RUM43_007818 [Polyplax serrata]|uniref:Uncharacterized protein n=1 Tax=Polyplax serrata TaxID=468196 RepID=A0AAN8P9A8_POLSC
MGKVIFERRAEPMILMMRMMVMGWLQNNRRTQMENEKKLMRKLQEREREREMDTWVPDNSFIPPFRMLAASCDSIVNVIFFYLKR